MRSRFPSAARSQPTTGLDTPQSNVVVAVLKELAAAGHTVIMTIHQPSHDAARLFDDLLLLRFGRVAYDSTAADASRWLGRALGGAAMASVLGEQRARAIDSGDGGADNADEAAYKTEAPAHGPETSEAAEKREPLRMNPAEVWLELITDSSCGPRIISSWKASAEAASAAASHATIIAAWADRLGDKPDGGAAPPAAAPFLADGSEPPALADVSLVDALEPLPPQRGGALLRRFTTVSRRTLLSASRRRVVLVITALEHLLVGLLYGSNYYDSPPDDDGLVDLLNGLFFSYLCATISSGAKAIPEVRPPRAVNGTVAW